MIRLRHLKMASRFVAHRFRELHPFDVQAILLNACNLRCVYCCCPDIKTKVMTTEQWKTIIHRLGTLGTMRIKFHGGEPTLRNDFRELCAEARRAGITTAVTTNGQKVPDQPELLDYLDEAIFSMDAATPEINDRLRGDGTHARVVKAIDIASKKGLRVYVNMVVNRESLSQLKDMLEFCEESGATLNAQPVVFGRLYSDDTAKHLELQPGETREMYRMIAEWKRKGRRIMFSASTYDRAVDWPNYSVLATRSVGESSCMAGKYYISIDPNGDVHPCGNHQANFEPKNVLNDGLEEALLHVSRHNCGDCWAPYLNERKALFKLRPAALREAIRRG